MNRVYFDANFLSRHTDYPNLFSRLKEQDVKVIYSKTTIRDANGTHHAETIVSQLEALDAQLISYSDDSGCQIVDRRPCDVWTEVQSESDDDTVSEFLKKLLAFSAGNAAGMSLGSVFDDFNEKLIGDLDELGREALLAGSPSTSLDIWRARKSLIDFPLGSTITPENTVNELENLGLKALRPPNVLKKVFVKVLLDVERMETNGNCEDFRNLIDDLVRRKQTGYDFQSIVHLGLLLSMMGFHQDKNLRKPDEAKGLQGARSDIRDAEHVTYACYCHAFFTRDKGAAKRHYAIVEWLGGESNTFYYEKKSKNIHKVGSTYWPPN